MLFWDRLKPSPKTWKNVRSILSHFFKWALSKKYVMEDPIPQVEVRKVKRSGSIAEALSAEQVAEIMAYAEDNPKPNKYYPDDIRRGMLVPYLALATFAGIRPDFRGEMGKLVPQNHINLETGVIRVIPQVAKMDDLRKVLIQPNLRLWLDKYPFDEFPLLPFDIGFRTEIEKLRKIFKIPYDGLRHTYISMLVGSFRSVADAALQAGNSESIIRKHYLDLKSVEESDRFWQIVPKGCHLPPMKKIREEGKFILKTDESGHMRTM